MIELNNQIGRDRNYRTAKAEVTSPISQYIFQNLGYGVANETPYNLFLFDDKRVFQHIDDCISCQLVVKELK